MAESDSDEFFDAIEDDLPPQPEVLPNAVHVAAELDQPEPETSSEIESELSLQEQIEIEARNQLEHPLTEPLESHLFPVDAPSVLLSFDFLKQVSVPSSSRPSLPPKPARRHLSPPELVLELPRTKIFEIVVGKKSLLAEGTLLVHRRAANPHPVASSASPSATASTSSSTPPPLDSPPAATSSSELDAEYTFSLPPFNYKCDNQLCVDYVCVDLHSILCFQLFAVFLWVLIVLSIGLCRLAREVACLQVNLHRGR